MNKAEFKASCEKANAALEAFDFTDDAKADLKTVNDGIKIVRVTRFVKRARMMIGAGVAMFAGAGVIAGGIISRDSVMLVISIIFGAILLFIGAMWFFSLRSAVTHKAICVTVDGKVQEYIYSKRGVFIFNTVETELICDHGKIAKKKHEYVKYEPSYPYVDFLDRDFSNFLKARTGEGYDGGEVYEHDKEKGAIYAYTDEGKKKRKFALLFDGNKPYKMEYLTRESYVYSHMNDASETVYLPTSVRGRLTPPSFLNIEYVDFSKDYEALWARL